MEISVVVNRALALALALVLAAGCVAGQDCASDPSRCPPGQLCLPATRGSGNVCRRPAFGEPCDNVAKCDASKNQGCLPVERFNTGVSGANYFPGHICVNISSRGQPCDITYNRCRAGLVCGATGLTYNRCVTAQQAALGQDCSQRDCAESLICQAQSGGRKRCIAFLSEGQSCNLAQFDRHVNPCTNGGKDYNVACLKGKCARGLPLGSSCTVAEDPSVSLSYTGQCDFSGTSVPSCIKSESGALKCLIVNGPNLTPCGDAINTGCFSPTARCISGYCGVPRGGQGDVCGPGKTCQQGLQCRPSSLRGAGSRCTAVATAGYSCDTASAFVTCARGLNCSQTVNDLVPVCLRGPVAIGGTCIGGETQCASGLVCVANDPPSRFPGYRGTCQRVSGPGGACNPRANQICDRNSVGVNFNVPALTCARGTCVNSTVGFWEDPCTGGPGTGVSCAPRDATAPLACKQNRCVHTDVPLGRACSLNNMFGPSNDCAAGLSCYAVSHPPPKVPSDYDILKCVRFVADGQACNYNRLIGCQQGNSSCVRGVCTRA